MALEGTGDARERDREAGRQADRQAGEREGFGEKARHGLGVPTAGEGRGKATGGSLVSLGPVFCMFSEKGRSGGWWTHGFMIFLVRVHRQNTGIGTI